MNSEYKTFKMGFINPFTLWHSYPTMFPFGFGIKKNLITFELPKVVFRKWHVPRRTQYYFQLLYFYVQYLKPEILDIRENEVKDSETIYFQGI